MAEVVRYDRQVRLWGAATQQQLRRTRVHVRGAHGAAAELAKNLVLAGVGALDVCDASAVTADDYRNNFLVQHEGDAAAAMTRGERVAAALRRLNPHVRVTVAHAHDNGDDGALVVGVAHARSLREVRAAAAHCAPHTSLLLVHVAYDAATVATLCLRRGDGEALTADATLCHAPTLAREAAPWQRVVLLLHLRDALSHAAADATTTSSMAHALVAATQLACTLQLRALTPRDVAAVARRARGGGGGGRACDAAAATMAGAAVASLVIQHAAARAHAGNKDDDGDAAPAGVLARARWLLCDLVAGEVRVGGATA